ncbi:MAG: thioredoxin [archaeon]|nr:thioredoxin [Nanoarchaeota archaeon]
MVLKLDNESFKQEVTEAPGLIIIDFWASWCGPCQAMAPVFEELSKDSDFEGKLKFAKVSTEDYPDLATASHVTGIPCLIVFKDGKEVNRVVGFSPKDALKAKIKAIVG